VALTSDQKKHLLIGSGIGALAFFLGSMIFGGRPAAAAPARVAQPRYFPPQVPPQPRRRKRRYDDRDDDNDRGAYGRKRKHNKKHLRDD
jgi:hypothetical protein